MSSCMPLEQLHIEEICQCIVLIIFTSVFALMFISISPSSARSMRYLTTSQWWYSQASKNGVYPFCEQQVKINFHNCAVYILWKRFLPYLVHQIFQLF